MADKYCYWCGEEYSAKNVSGNIMPLQWACSFCASDDEIYNFSKNSNSNLAKYNDLKPATTGCQSFGKTKPRIYLTIKGYAADFTDPLCPVLSVRQQVFTGNPATLQPPNWNGSLPLPNAYSAATITNNNPPPVPNANNYYCIGCNNQLTGGLQLICKLCYADPKILAEYRKIRTYRIPNPSTNPWIGAIGFDKSIYGSSGPPWHYKNISGALSNAISNALANAKTPVAATVPAKPYSANAALKDYLILTGLLPKETGPVLDNKVYPSCPDCGMPVSKTLDAYYGKDPEQAAKCKECRD